MKVDAVYEITLTLSDQEARWLSGVASFVELSAYTTDPINEFLGELQRVLDAFTNDETTHGDLGISFRHA